MNNINKNLKNIELFVNNNISNNEDKIICNYLINNLQNKINYYIIENNDELIQNNINTEIKKQNFVENSISENKDDNKSDNVSGNKDDNESENVSENKDDNKLNDNKTKLSFIEERINDINNKFLLYMQNKEQIDKILNDFYFQISNNNLLENLSSIYNIQDE